MMAGMGDLKWFAVLLLFLRLGLGSAQESSIVYMPSSSGFTCTSGPLGMESGDIPDRGLTSSSSYSGGYSPQKARLNVAPVHGWMPSSITNQWIQVDLGDFAAVSGLIVQGYSNWYVSVFTVQHSMTGESEDWQSLTDNEGEMLRINGNDASGGQETVLFPELLMTRFLRIWPVAGGHSSYRNMKFEILGCRDGLVRLVDGDGVKSGRVEIYHDGAWGTVCDRDWGIKDATTVCRQFDFSEAEEATNSSFFGESSLPIKMDRVACKGTESGLADCPFVCARSDRCRNSTEAGVVCKKNTIRLVGGSNNTRGRVEIYRDGQWGTICDNDWDITDAGVACRQLGFAGAEEATSGGYFGQGEGVVHMDGVSCDGSEGRVIDCPSHCWRTTNNCTSTQDAGVICLDVKNEQYFGQWQ